jgi:hypothetical protein
VDVCLLPDAVERIAHVGGDEDYRIVRATARSDRDDRGGEERNPWSERG